MLYVFAAKFLYNGVVRMLLLVMLFPLKRCV
jgi:hypothetical protein